MLRPMRGGARRAAWLCDMDGRRAVAKSAAPSEPSLRWQDQREHRLHRLGWITPGLIETPSDALSSRGWAPEAFLHGGPASRADLRALPLARLHRLRMPPRPGHVRPLVEGVAHPRRPVRPDRPDPRRPPPGQPARTPPGLAVLDWEEARLGPLRIDHATVTGRRADHARAELAACARAEPDRAATMARHFLARGRARR